MKAIIFLSFIIQPWPPDDFGMLIDTQTFVEYDEYGTGMQVDAFMLYTKAIFGKDILHGANFTPKVGLIFFLFFFHFFLLIFTDQST
jgi:hypothetical protein